MCLFMTCWCSLNAILLHCVERRVPGNRVLQHTMCRVRSDQQWGRHGSQHLPHLRLLRIPIWHQHTHLEGNLGLCRYKSLHMTHARPYFTVREIWHKHAGQRVSANLLLCSSLLLLLETLTELWGIILVPPHNPVVIIHLLSTTFFSLDDYSSLCLSKEVSWSIATFLPQQARVWDRKSSGFSFLLSTGDECIHRPA